MKKIIVSVPAKIHLMGEHAVVYGKPAILTAIDKRLYVTLTSSNKLEIITKEEPKLVKEAIRVVCKKFNIKSAPLVKVEINSEIPSGYHIGSSAALSVAVVSALTYYLKKIWNRELFNELAFAVEKLQHGNPSGGDNTAVTYGGSIWFRRELPFLTSIWQLPLKNLPNLARFFLLDSGRPKENTGEMVSAVADFVKKNPKKAQNLLDLNEKATKEVAKAVKEGNEKRLIAAIRKGERTLEGLGVVSRKITPFIRVLEKTGGAVKILGGGGKSNNVGYLLAYHPSFNKLNIIAKKYNYPLSKIKLGEEGVRLES